MITAAAAAASILSQNGACCIYCCTMLLLLLLVRAQELYVLMRIHHVLCDRLGKAVTLAEDAKALKDMQVARNCGVCCG